MSYFKQRIKLFHNHSFAWYTLSSFLSTIGTGLSYVAMGWLIVSLDSKVNAILWLMIFFWLPNVLLSPVMGVITDRYPRKWSLLVANFSWAAAFFIFTFCVGDHYTVKNLYLLALAWGVFFSVYGPASMGFIREIVLRDDLLYANSTIDISYEVGNVIGMASAGFLIGKFSSEIAFIINGVFFALAGLILFFIKPVVVSKKVIEIEKKSFYKDFKLGLNYLLNRKLLLLIYTIQLIVMAQFIITPSLVAPYVKNVLHATITEFGYIEASLSLGIIMGGILLPWLSNYLGVTKVLFLMTCVTALTFFAFFFANSVYLTQILYGLIGVGLSMWSLVVTMAQGLTDLNYQGRVQAMFNSLSGVLVLFLIVLIGVVSNVLNVKNMFSVEIIFCLVNLFLIVQLTKQMKLRVKG